MTTIYIYIFILLIPLVLYNHDQIYIFHAFLKKWLCLYVRDDNVLLWVRLMSFADGLILLLCWVYLPCSLFTYPFLNQNVYFILAYCLMALYLHIEFYTYLGLKRGIKSFIYFFTNVFLLTFYLYMSYILIKGDIRSIYLEEYSKISAIRHLITIILILMAGLSLLFLRYKNIPRLQNFLNKASTPVLKEEIERILKVYEEAIFGPFFDTIMRKAIASAYWKFCLYSIYVFFYVLLPLTQVGILIKFTFFAGNLKYIFYLMPLFLLSFIFKNLWYYLQNFVSFNISAIKEIMDIESPYQKYIKEGEDIIMPVYLSQIKISLTKKAEEEYAAEGIILDVPRIRNSFLLLLQFDYILYQLKNIKKWLDPLILLLRLFCSSEIVSVILFGTSFNDFLVIQGFLIKMIPKIGPNIVRSYATRAHYIHEKDRATFERENPKLKADHPMAVNVEKTDAEGNAPLYHQVTRGAAQGQAHGLHESKNVKNKEDLSGCAAVYPETPTSINISKIGKPLKGSEDFYKDPQTRSNDMKNDPHSYPNDKHD